MRKIKHDERNFITTRIWQVAHEIVEIAERFNAVVAIEKLKYPRKYNGKGKKPKRANRKIHRIPFAKFRTAIQSVAWQSGIDVVEILAARTSQGCPKCGYTSKKNWVFFNGKRKLFRCKCGYEANPDRTASRNIATLALERISFLKPSAPSSSFPELAVKSVTVSGPMRRLDGIAKHL